jgi:uncharacterized protein YdeI (YjbR/CyaY-like superfamily)
MDTLELETIEAWRAWLKENHDTVSEIWLVYYKKATGLPTLAYSETLDEALCYGWIDSLIKKIDEKRYARKFTPRKENSNWSLVNKKRVKELIEEGRMTEHGLRLVEAAKSSGQWDNPVEKPDFDLTMIPDFEQALKDHPKAAEAFDGLAPSYQKQYIGWIYSAKRQATKEKRIKEAVELLEQGKKLGMR